jgi:peptidoglycan hydrolase-like protein with peptidoglycan-binding domain
MVAAVLVACGWSLRAAMQPRTEAQLAALATPPPPTQVTAEVKAGPLVDSTTVTGSLTQVTVFTVAGPQSSPGVLRQVVTGLPLKTGDRVRSGQVLGEVSGRPVIALKGAFAAYRDIEPGMTGPDVRQLQRALRSRYGTPVSEKFDTRTQDDVRRLYRAIGYPAPTVAEESKKAVRDDAEEPKTQPSPGLVLPAGEVAFVPHLPAGVGSVPAKIGGDGTKTLVTLASGGWRLKVRLDEDAAEIPEGAKFFLDDRDGPAVQLLNIGAPTGDDEKSIRQAMFAVEGTPADAVNGQSRELLVEKGRSPDGAVVVPASAIWTATDGSTSVTVVDAAGRQTSVPVESTVAVGGRVAVRATSGALPVGAKVIVARRDGS